MKNLTIISGGQTGVDRAALDVAIRLGLDYSGWCPKDGWAEDMPEFPGLLTWYSALKETPLHNPVQRTKWNVRDSSATLIILAGSDLSSSPGTALTIKIAEQLEKTFLIDDIENPEFHKIVLDWLSKFEVPQRLNIAGPRESEVPGIYDYTCLFLLKLLCS